MARRQPKNGTRSSKGTVSTQLKTIQHALRKEYAKRKEVLRVLAEIAMDEEDEAECWGSCSIDGEDEAPPPWEEALKVQSRRDTVDATIAKLERREALLWQKDQKRIVPVFVKQQRVLQATLSKTIVGYEQQRKRHPNDRDLKMRIPQLRGELGDAREAERVHFERYRRIA